MARPLRLEFSGALYHLTARGNAQADIFLDDHDRSHFLQILAETVIRFGWKLYAWVLMTNHYHLEVETPEPNLSRGMHWLNGRYAQSFNRKYRRSGHLLQGRFKGLLIERESYLLEVARYVVLNPVRAGMVARAEDWKWSSYRATAGLEPAPQWLASPDLLRSFGTDVARSRTIYSQFVGAFDLNAPPLWDQLTDQIYLGTPAWLDRIQTLIGDRPRSMEHPQAQLMVGRPTIADVLDAVHQTFEKSDSGTPLTDPYARRIAAFLAFEEGLVRQSEIAAALGSRSRGAAGYLIARCKRAMTRESWFRDLVDEVRSRMRRRLPEYTQSPSEFTYPFHRRRAYIPGAP